MNTDVLARRSDLHLVRKLWHVSWGLIALFAYFTKDHPLSFYGWIAFWVGLSGFTLDFIRLKNKNFNRFAVRVLAPILRRSEMQSFSGLPFYAMGSAMSIYFYQDDIALLSILFLVIADPMASVVGVLFGKDNILPNKTLQGTLACFFSCYFIITAYTWNLQIPGYSLVGFGLFGALSGAISELFSAFNIDDNFTIPVVAGAGLTLVNGFFHIF